ncbi:hypothetical protein [Nocardia inohanensis]|uniref:hypothetical protein n=1 Tax=Nocardia inohanensis TaxID=209246 RepID=UPI000831AE80|nr:hypothetical protein [Nocardia inohanensis]
MKADLECCDERMSLVPAPSKDWPITQLMHCYQCGHFEPYDPEPVSPESTAPSCLCGTGMVDLPPAQWDRTRFKIAHCPGCGNYETWGIAGLRRDDGNQPPERAS